MSTEEKELEITTPADEAVPAPEAESAPEAAVAAEEEAPAAEEPAAEEAATEEAPAKKNNRRQRKPVDPAVWDALQEDFDDNKIFSVKINAAVKAGVISYVNGIRGFIPASQLSTAYVENLEDWVGKSVDVKIITVDPEEKRLVLSGKAVEQEREAEEKAAKIAAVSVGDVYDGKVEKIVSFGAFVNFADGLSGLVHISQMANKRIETPNEVVKVGDEVKVRVIGNNEGKIKLSMKQAAEGGEHTPSSRPSREPSFNYKEEGRATTSLGDMLKNIKLD